MISEGVGEFGIFWVMFKNGEGGVSFVVVFLIMVDREDFDVFIWFEVSI